MIRGDIVRVGRSVCHIDRFSGLRLVEKLSIGPPQTTRMTIIRSTVQILSSSRDRMARPRKEKQSK